MNMKRHADIRIFGEVRGVSFRYFAKQEAENLNLSGFAQNRPDGSVYIEAEGGEESLQKFIGWCRHGPPTARVEKIEVVDGPVRNFAEFEVRR